MTTKDEVAITIPPVHFTMNEDTTLLLKNADLLANINVDSAKSLHIISIINPQGTLINNNNSTWSFTPSKYFSGPLILDCIISDGMNKTVQPIMIEVLHPSKFIDNPEVELLIQADGTFLINSQQLIENATDIEGESLNIIAMNAAQGDFVNNNDGSWKFLPNSEYFGIIDLQFIVSDGQAQITQNLVITVNNPQVMPEIDYIMNENDSLTFSADDLIQSAMDIEGDSLAITDLLQPKTGQLINNDNGTWTYLPAENYIGPVKLQFGISDNRGAIIDQAINIYTLSDEFATLETKILSMQPNGTVIITPEVLLEEGMDIDYQNSISNLATKHGTLKQIGSKKHAKWIFTPNNLFTGTIELQYILNSDKNQTLHNINIEVVNNFN